MGVDIFLKSSETKVDQPTMVLLESLYNLLGDSKLANKQSTEDKGLNSTRSTILNKSTVLTDPSSRGDITIQLWFYSEIWPM